MINTFTCQSAGGNTGIGDCSLEISKIVGFFLVNKDFALSVADLADNAALQSALIAASQADSRSERIFPVHNLVDIADNTADPTEQTFGYGPSVIVQDGPYNWTFPFLRGGICLLKSLQTFNGSDIRVIFYDSNGTLFGWRVGDTLKGVPLTQFYANPWRPNTGAATMVTNVRMSFDPIYLNQQLGFVKVTDFALSSIEGLQNIAIRQSGVQAKPVYKVKLFAGCAGVDLYEQYSTELADPALWVATNKATGAVITITSVAVDANIKGFTVTLSAVDTDYPAVGSILLTLAPVSDLVAAGVVGFEGLTLTIVNV